MDRCAGSLCAWDRYVSRSGEPAPQATLAWMLAFIFAPGVGVLIYFLFGRDRKAFSKQSELLRQDLEADAFPLLAPMLCRQDEEITRLEDEECRPQKADAPREAQFQFGFDERGTMWRSSRMRQSFTPA